MYLSIYTRLHGKAQVDKLDKANEGKLRSEPPSTPNEKLRGRMKTKDVISAVCRPEFTNFLRV